MSSLRNFICDSTSFVPIGSPLTIWARTIFMCLIRSLSIMRSPLIARVSRVAVVLAESSWSVGASNILPTSVCMSESAQFVEGGGGGEGGEEEGSQRLPHVVARLPHIAIKNAAASFVQQIAHLHQKAPPHMPRLPHHQPPNPRFAIYFLTYPVVKNHPSALPALLLLHEDGAERCKRERPHDNYRCQPPRRHLTVQIKYIRVLGVPF